MRLTRTLTALAVALSLAASPLTFARGSGFGSSGGRSSVSSFSSTRSFTSSRPSTPSPSPAPRTSGFSSARDTSSGASTATKVATASALGGALYTAHASKAAADTYAANKAATTTDNSGAATRGTSGTTSGATSNASSSNAGAGYAPPTYSYQRPVEVHNHYNTASSGGSGDLLTGYLLGRATSRHDTVIVQQPAVQPVYTQPQAGYIPQPAGVVTADGVQPGAATTAMVPAQAPDQAPPIPLGHAHHVAESFFHFVFKLLVWGVVIGLGIFAAVLLSRAWTARQARYTAKNNYKL